MFRIVFCEILCLVIAFTNAYPSSWYSSGVSCRNSGKCYAPVGTKPMGKSAQAGSGSVTFNPGLINGKYTPGQTYTISESFGYSGQKLIGASKGSIDGNPCTCGGTVGSGNSDQWTAPQAGSGSVEIGITIASGYNAVPRTTVANIEEGPVITKPPTGAPSKSPSPKPTSSPTPPPTSIPTQAPTKAPSPMPTFSPTIDCTCLGLSSQDDAYCDSTYDGLTTMSRNNCESDPKCKWGPEAGLDSPSYPECSLVSAAPTSSSPSSTPSSSPSSSPSVQPTSDPTSLPTSYPTTTPSSSPSTPPPSVSPSSMPTVSFTGYIIDTLCLTIVNVNDFTNTTEHPENHTLNCLLKSYCIESGFTVMEKLGPNKYGAKYQIDASDVIPQVVPVLESASCISNFSVTVVGTELGGATYNGQSTYNGGAMSFGTVLKLKSITGMCGGDVILPPAGASTTAPLSPQPSSTASPSSPSDPQSNRADDGDKYTSSTIGIIAGLTTIALIIMIVFEVAGSRIQTDTQKLTYDRPSSTEFQGL